MKKKILYVVIFAMIAAMLFGTVYSSAASTYETYTYSIDGEVLKSPEAYHADDSFDSIDMNLVSEKFGGLALNDAKDVFADYQGNLYIADTGNNRIVILNKYYGATKIINGYVDENGKAQTFSKPQGVFVTNPTINADGTTHLYVCDTDNERIVVFDEKFEYIRTLEQPESKLIDKGDFKPTAIAVDLYGRLFVISPNCYEGVIVMSGTGEFTGFIGAQKVTFSLLERIWRRFQTEEQKNASVQNVSIAYNNITVDDQGFVYVTNDNIEPESQFKSIKTKVATYAPVKKLNSSGEEIMSRNGFFNPGGEVLVMSSLEVSNIIDVAIGDQNTWTIMDSDPSRPEARIRLFTYDQSGNLLFAYATKGEQLGQGANFVSTTYQVIDGVYYMVVLDKTNSGKMQLIVYSPTEYCDTIISAIRNQNEHNYTDSIYFWQDVLTRNNNFDLAYIGIGKALYSQGKYSEAMEMLSKAYETKYYSTAFKEIRKDSLQSFMVPMIILLIGVIYLFFKFLGWAKVKNKATSLKVGQKTYGEELLYAFHLVFHPFDGFWDIKHEKRGSVRAGLTILGLTILSFFYQSIGTGYIFNPRGNYSTIFAAIGSVGVLVILFCVANWCFTTLFDGEGSFKDIFIASCYSLAPLPLFVTLSTILTNVFTSSEGSIVTLLVTLGYVWVGILLFFGTLVTHDYSINKNIVSTLCTIVAMMIIMFIAILFSGLVVKMVTFVSSVISEISNRI